MLAISMSAESNRDRLSLFVGPSFAAGGPVVATTAPAGPRVGDDSARFGLGQGTAGDKGRGVVRIRTAADADTLDEARAPPSERPDGQLADLRPYMRWSFRLVVRESGKPATKVVGATRVFMLKKSAS